MSRNQHESIRGSVKERLKEKWRENLLKKGHPDCPQTIFICLMLDKH